MRLGGPATTLAQVREVMETTKPPAESAPLAGQVVNLARAVLARHAPQHTVRTKQYVVPGHQL